MTSSELRIRTLLTGPQEGLKKLSVLPDSDGLLQHPDQSANSSTPYPEYLSIDIPKGSEQASRETNDETLLWTIEETARQLSVHPRTVNRLIEKGELPVVRIGRAVRIEIQAVHHFLNKQREYNGHCVESALSHTGESLRDSISETVSTKLPTSQQVENRLDALLKPVTNE